MRYIATKSRGGYLVKDLATLQVVARMKTYAAAAADASRRSAAYLQLIHDHLNTTA